MDRVGKKKLLATEMQRTHLKCFQKDATGTYVSFTLNNMEDHEMKQWAIKAIFFANYC